MPAEKTTPRFPPPWSIEQHAECFMVRDAAQQALGYFYFDEEPHRPHGEQAPDERRGAAHGDKFRETATHRGQFSLCGTNAARPDRVFKRTARSVWIYAAAHLPSSCSYRVCAVATTRRSAQCRRLRRRGRGAQRV